MRSAGRRLALCGAATIAAFACGRRPAPLGDPSGVYWLTSSPAVEQCGAAQFVFPAMFVSVAVEGTTMTVYWTTAPSSSEYDVADAPGTIFGRRFEEHSQFERQETLFCPSTGANEVVTHFDNAWTGTFGRDSFDSVFTQSATDTCATLPTDCTLTWAVHGVRETRP